MTARRPLVVVSGGLKELPDGDTINLVPIPSLAEHFGGMIVQRRALDRLFTRRKPARTTLAGSIDNATSTTTVTTAKALPFAAKHLIKIDSEEMFVTSGFGTTTLTVVRRVNGTAIASHTAGAAILTDAILKIGVVGDSTVQDTVVKADDTASPEPWPTMLARILSRQFGLTLLGPSEGSGGWYPMYRNNDANIASNAAANTQAAEWTATGGSWALQSSGGANDKALYGWGLTASGSTNILTLTPHAAVLAEGIAGFDIYSSDLLSAAYAYRIDGGSWTDVTATGPGANIINGSIVRQRVAAPITATLDIKASNVANTSKTPFIHAVDVWTTMPTFGVTKGIKLYNLGFAGRNLANLNHTNASGDNFAYLDGYPGSLFLDLLIVGSFTNDVTDSGFLAAYATNLAAVASRATTFSDLVFIGFGEQSGRSTTDQATMRAALKAQSVTSKAASLDLYDAWAAAGFTGYTAANTEGLMNNDSLHPAALGSRDIAGRVGRLISVFA